MKTNVDSMSSDMYKLKVSASGLPLTPHPSPCHPSPLKPYLSLSLFQVVMDNVSNQTSGLCDKLQKRRETMEELQRVQGLVKKLQAVFDLPKKMRAALEGDMLESAVGLHQAPYPPHTHPTPHTHAFLSITTLAEPVQRP